MNEGTWSSGPGAFYSPHTHPYHKTLTCLEGQIEMIIHGKSEKRVLLMKGDVLGIEPGTSHSAQVGPEGVTCHEAHSNPGR